MAYDNPVRIHGYRRIIELLFVVLIISVLTENAVSIYSDSLAKAVTTHATGSYYQKARMDSVYYHAFHGTWPKNNTEATRFGFHDTYTEDDKEFIKDFFIENGAMTFVFEKGLPDKKLTIRPAVPVEDQLGPIIWVCGNKRSMEGWRIFGEDRTDIEDKYIHTNLR